MGCFHSVLLRSRILSYCGAAGEQVIWLRQHIVANLAILLKRMYLSAGFISFFIGLGLCVILVSGSSIVPREAVDRPSVRLMPTFKAAVSSALVDCVTLTKPPFASAYTTIVNHVANPRSASLHLYWLPMFTVLGNQAYILPAAGRFVKSGTSG